MIGKRDLRNSSPAQLFSFTATFSDSALSLNCSGNDLKGAPVLSVSSYVLGLVCKLTLLVVNRTI